MHRHLPVVALSLLAACQPADPRQITSLTPELEPVVVGNNDFAWDMLQTVSGLDDQNVFFSPFSMVACLSMLYAGANGESEAQIGAAMSVPEGGEDGWHENLTALLADLTGEHYRDYTLYSANRIWGQAGYPFEADYLDLLANSYLAPLTEVDFTADAEAIRSEINDWVADQTRDRIPSIFEPGDISATTRFALVNAIYFLADWRTGFEPDDTTDRAFTLADGSEIQVPTMHASATVNAIQHDDGTMVLQLPYEGDELSMVILLPPTADGIDALVASLSDATVSGLLADLGEREEVDVFLPSFEMSYTLPFADALMALGIVDVFDPSLSDLSGIVAPTVEQLYVQAARHKAFVRVDEAGTEAAAATGISGEYTMAESGPYDSIHVDRPFVYVIQDDLTGAVLFAGRMMDPSAAPLQD